MNPRTAIPQRVFTRELIKPADVRPQFEGFEVIGTFNPGAIEFEGGVAMLIRVAERPAEIREGFVALPYWDHDNRKMAIDWQRLEDIDRIDPRIVRIKASGHLRLTFVSWLLVAFSRDGLKIDRFGDSPFAPNTPYEAFGIEDPRLTRFGDRFYFTYVAVSRHGIATALASSRDFQSFERHGIVFPPENKDVVLFPEQIDGKFWALHRPNPNAHLSQPEIWIARSPDLLHWGGHEPLLGNQTAWADVKVGGGTPPIRTRAGWLSLYHGHIRPAEETLQTGGIGEYAAATLLQDLDDPRRIVGVSAEPVMRAEIDFEKRGYLPNIVFPTALLHHDEWVDVYYGAADTVSGVARYVLDDLLETVRQ
jgi:beta-1,2-mannobiose phosphorylase / 1,2-beta-oligomannan phosphorylase